MLGDDRRLKPQDFSPGGPSHRLAHWLGLSSPHPPKRIVKVSLLVVLTWAPLLVLSWLAGHATFGQVEFPFLRDVDAFARYLFALPLLEVGTVMATALLPIQMQHFDELKLIPEHESSRFALAQHEFVRLRDSAWAEGVKLALAFALPLLTRLGLGYSVGDSSWEVLDGKLTAAGWWHLCVSLPLLYFFLLRRLWTFAIWSWFLYRVSKLKLDLSPTHPDRSGGLGFVARGQAAFSLYLMAGAAMVSAGFGEEILNRGKSLDDMKYHVALFVALAMLVIHAPLLAFTRQLLAIRQKGLLEFSHLVFRYDRAFDRKWCEGKESGQGDDILGHSDFQSFAAIVAGFEHVKEMWPFPFDTKTFAVLALSSILPMLPLLGTEIPLREILAKLGELMI